MTDLTCPPGSTGTPTATATVNGERYPLTAPTTVARLVATLLPSSSRTAPPGRRGRDRRRRARPQRVESTTLRDGDQVEVVTAVQGG
ncbi:sulfur carrier protein ThiS [Oerskovia sp. M15]